MITNMPFWICAVFGTTILFIQMIMMFTGMAFDSDVYGDVESPGGAEDSFKVLSLQTISAFFMAFGWGGLAATEQFSLPPAVGILIAIVVGLIFVFIIRSIFKFAISLNSRGAEYTLNEILGKKFSVYERIPSGGGSGKIQVFVGGMLRDISALSESNLEIQTGKEVEVTEIVNISTVKVK